MVLSLSFISALKRAFKEFQMNNKKARNLTKGLKGAYSQPSDTLVSAYGCKWTTPRKGSFKK